MTEVKKGTKSWKPASYLPVQKVPPGYRVKWAYDDPANIERLENEGWIHPSQVGGAQHIKREDRATIEDGKNLTQSEKKYRELRVMLLDEETYHARQEYIQGQNDKSVRSLKRFLDDGVKNKEGGKSATTYGKIIIE